MARLRPANDARVAFDLAEVEVDPSKRRRTSRLLNELSLEFDVVVATISPPLTSICCGFVIFPLVSSKIN